MLRLPLIPLGALFTDNPCVLADPQLDSRLDSYRLIVVLARHIVDLQNIIARSNENIRESLAAITRADSAAAACASALSALPLPSRFDCR